MLPLAHRKFVVYELLGLGARSTGRGDTSSSVTSRVRCTGSDYFSSLEDMLFEVVVESTYSAGLDNRLAIYINDIKSAVSHFRAHRQKSAILSKDAYGMTYYSVIARVPMSQQILEIISLQERATSSYIFRLSSCSTFLSNGSQDGEHRL